MRDLAILSSRLVVALPVPASEPACIQDQRYWDSLYRIETDVCVWISHAIIVVTVVIYALIVAVVLEPSGGLNQIVIHAQDAALFTTLEIWVLNAINEQTYCEVGIATLRFRESFQSLDLIALRTL